MWFRKATVCALLISLSAEPTLAGTTLAGNTGLVKVPTADVLSEGELALGFSWLGGTSGYLFRPLTNRNYFLTAGLMPGLEVSIDYLQVIGWVDPQAPGVAYAFHRLSNLKYQLPFPFEGLPRVAIGAQDPLSVNALTRGPVGQTSYGLTAFYGVASHQFERLSLHLGYGVSSGYLRGVFFGAESPIGWGFKVSAEYDAEAANLGLRWQPTSWLSVQVARLFPNDWAYGATIGYRL